MTYNSQDSDLFQGLVQALALLSHLASFLVEGKTTVANHTSITDAPILCALTPQA